MKTVDFYFDFGSPNAYLAHKLIPSIAQRTGASFNYVPVLLGGVFKLTNNIPPMQQFKDVKNKREYLQREMQRFVQKHAVPFQRNPHFPVNTVTVMRGAMVAQQEGFLPRYVDAVYPHMWETPKKLDDVEVIRATLTEASLDAEHILARTQEQEIKDALANSTQAAVTRGIFGCPSFFVGEEMFFGKDRLAQVEEEILRARIDPPASL